MRGTKPKPTKLKILAGVKPSRINRSEPTATPGRPDPPGHLCPVARAEWDRVVPLLEDMQVLTKSDGSALAVYCEAFARCRAANEHIREYGLILVSEHVKKNRYGEVVQEQTVVKPNPAINVVNVANLIMMRVLCEFGMTPSSRSRIKADLPAPVDDLAEFLGSKKA